MNQISSTKELLANIAALEAENSLRALQMKQDFGLIVEKFSPALVITKTLQGVASSPFFKGDFLGIGFGILSGWLTKKLYVRGSSNSIRNLIGLAVQFGMTNLAANNFDIIKSFARNLFQKSPQGKEDTTG